MPARPDTLFGAASLSKVVLALAVHDMVRERLVDFDRPVVEHVVFTDDAATRAITPRHLLSRSSGLPNWRDGAGEPPVSAFAPGARSRYSGEGFVLLGRLVEARVLRPAGMSRSSHGWARGAEPAVAWAGDDGGAVLADKGPAGDTMSRNGGHQSRSIAEQCQTGRRRPSRPASRRCRSL